MKDRFIQLAIQQAEQSAMPNRLGAVVVRKKSVIGAGYNRSDHPWLYRNSILKLHPKHGMHAEVSALYGADDSEDAIMYVVRLRKNDSIGLAKPCLSCASYIKINGIKRVIYSEDDGSFNLMRIR